MKLGTFNADRKDIDLVDIENDVFTWNMDICIIPTNFQNTEYFNFPDFGSLGIAPTVTTSHLNRQFLYKIHQENNLVYESYVMLSKNFTVVFGASIEDVPTWNFNPKKFLTQPHNYILPYSESQGYNSSLLLEQSQIELKIGEYLPPSSDNAMETIYLNTNFRAMHLPNHYFAAFTRTFAVPDLTCNQRKGNTNFGRDFDHYVCTCYGNNYNGMPEISLQTGKQPDDSGYNPDKYTVYEQKPGDYMFMPYVN